MWAGFEFIPASFLNENHEQIKYFFPDHNSNYLSIINPYLLHAYLEN